MENAITVEQLSKTFKIYKRREGLAGSVKDLLHRQYSQLAAVDNVSFKVKPAEIVGFIGPNGAGKSTTIKMLTGILKPTSGDMNVLGFNPYQQRRSYSAHIGVVFGQRTQLWWDIAVIESFRLLGKIYKIPDQEFKQRLDTLIEILQISEVLHTPVRKLSLGQRLRCDLAASLLHGPRLVFLDEPTIGVDAVAKSSIRSFLRKINRDLKTTIILTTHDLVEIEELCERIIIIDKGKLVYDGDLERIKQLPGLEAKVVIDFQGERKANSEEALIQPGMEVLTDKENRNRLTIKYRKDRVRTVDVVKQVVEQFDLNDLSIQEPEIEDILIRIYNEGLEVGAFGKAS